MIGYRLISGPASEPVTVAEAKSQLHITSSNYDDYLSTIAIPAARAHTEIFLQRALITRVLDIYYSRFGRLKLPWSPLQSVDQVKYLDGNNVEQTLHPSVYEVDDIAEPSELHLAYGQAWPSLGYRRNPVTVRITTGYGNASDIPPDIRIAILLLVGHLNENREMTSPAQINTVPHGYEALLWPYRIQEF